MRERSLARYTGTFRSCSLGAVSARALIASVMFAPSAARAQNSYSPINVFDPYGNARGVDVDRRSVGTFQNDVQERALRGFQDTDRRGRQRGESNPFILPGDVPLFRPPPATANANELFPGATTAASARKSYAMYGGFEPKVESPETGGEAIEAMTRRRMLIEATTVNAPIHRSLTRDASAYGLRRQIEQTPFDASLADEPPTRTVVEGLRHGVERAYERTRTEAWAWFREGEYRRAARAFETAGMLNRSDQAAAIGEIVSYWSLAPEAPRTPIAILGQLMRRGGNPFSHDLNLAGAYPDLQTAQRMMIRAKLQAAPDDVNAQVAALDALVLWYLGERTEALLVADKLGRRPAGAAFAEWPTKMREAMNAPGSEK